LAAVERARKKQASRIANLKPGDANPKFFQQEGKHEKKEKSYTKAKK
jgi:hypothetical protein